MRFEVKVFDRSGNYIETLEKKSFKSHTELELYLKEKGYKAPDLKVVIKRLERGVR